ncbi:hypothetical protein EYC84_001864 [Monilinia fructicola]|uniref:Cutinase n=1 Tax=Monilinia fructicola TaxID=38448 RepID=A0A5M9JYX9_MONFR|nr:hypothetical protein EYC84_001864 [Monilinia fructicola]
MHYSSIALGLSLTTLASAAGYYPRASTGGCVGDGAVHMIVARASTEPAGEGIIGSVATMVKKQLPGSDSEAVGANVAADVMCGSSGMGGGMGMGFGLGTMGAGSGATQGSSDVVAMVLMGDPTHVPTDSFNAGTSKKAGMFPRKNSANCPADKTVSYCDTGDTFCDSGMSTAVHLGYVTKYGTAAAKFITDKVSGSSTSTSTSNGTASSGGTSGAAASGAASGASSLGGLGSSGASSLSAVYHPAWDLSVLPEHLLSDLLAHLVRLANPLSAVYHLAWAAVSRLAWAAVSLLEWAAVSRLFSVVEQLKLELQLVKEMFSPVKLQMMAARMVSNWV